MEIGWRLAADHWGRGLAAEVATAALRTGFMRLGVDEIVAVTEVSNGRSQALMERLGMTRGGTFDHPALALDDPLRPHVAYRLSQARFAQLAAAGVMGYPTA